MGCISFIFRYPIYVSFTVFHAVNIGQIIFLAVDGSLGYFLDFAAAVQLGASIVRG